MWLVHSQFRPGYDDKLHPHRVYDNYRFVALMTLLCWSAEKQPFIQSINDDWLIRCIHVNGHHTDLVFKQCLSWNSRLDTVKTHLCVEIAALQQQMQKSPFPCLSCNRRFLLVLILRVNFFKETIQRWAYFGCHVLQFPKIPVQGEISTHVKNCKSWNDKMQH